MVSAPAGGSPAEGAGTEEEHTMYDTNYVRAEQKFRADQIREGLAGRRFRDRIKKRRKEAENSARYL